MKSEMGFTLVELLVTTVILGIVTAALAASIIVGLRTTDDTQTRLSESHDAQIVAAYFVTDVQSSDDVSTTDTTCAGVSPIARFRWTDNAVVKVASYYVEDASGEHRLMRRYCEDGTVVDTLPVVHFLSTSVGPSLTCTPSCTSTPSSVSISITEPSGYNYSLSATRRATG